MNRLSNVFRPVVPVPKSVGADGVTVSKSHKLMVEQGVIAPSSSGMFHLLPFAMRALKKLEDLVDKAMEEVGAQRIQMPSLTSTELWRKSGRLKNDEPLPLFEVQDRQKKQYFLNPTCEETITHLVAQHPSLAGKLPLRLYQISSKFRDELRPRTGLLRSREFVMKDLYTFDVSNKDAQDTYIAVSQAYNKIFKQLGVHFVRVRGDTGDIGGILSHEYHFPTEVGQDKLVFCEACLYGANEAMHKEESNNCPSCKKNVLTKFTGIEVAHTFLLGTKYSVPFKATVRGPEGEENPLVMGCYGLGLTRTIAAALEVLSTPDELRWPLAIAPYAVCIIPPKDGSKEEGAASLTQGLYDLIDSQPLFHNNVIVDDRTDRTIGRRLRDAKLAGFPLIVVIGHKAMEDVPRFEVFDLLNDQQYDWTDGSVLARLKEYQSGKETVAI